MPSLSGYRCILTTSDTLQTHQPCIQLLLPLFYTAEVWPCTFRKVDTKNAYYAFRCSTLYGGRWYFALLKSTQYFNLTNLSNELLILLISHLYDIFCKLTNNTNMAKWNVWNKHTFTFIAMCLSFMDISLGPLELSLKFLHASSKRLYCSVVKIHYNMCRSVSYWSWICICLRLN